MKISSYKPINSTLACVSNCNSGHATEFHMYVQHTMYKYEREHYAHYYYCFVGSISFSKKQLIPPHLPTCSAISGPVAL